MDGSGLDLFAGLGTDAQGNTYIAGSTQAANFPVKSAAQNHSASPGKYDVFVTKLDPSGNIVYSTYYGGSADDIATAIAVDPAGNVYVTGTTQSPDFPTTPGTYAPSPPAPLPPIATFMTQAAGFLFKLNADGSVGYSTYFSAISSQVAPNAIAVDSTGSVYVTGTTYGGVPVTPGAYQTTCACVPVEAGFFLIGVTDGFLTRFDAAAAKLIYSTYLGVSYGAGNALAVAPDGSAYVGGPTGIYRLDATGSSLLASTGPVVDILAMALRPDGALYVAGGTWSGANALQPTAGVFQTDPGTGPALPAQGVAGQLGIALMDAQLQNVLAATYFGGRYGEWLKTLALDHSGNLYLGGYTPPVSLPTRTPLVEGFGPSSGTGFVSELSGDLTTLLFSSYFGDSEYFGVTGLGIGSNGSIALGGATLNGSGGNIWVNSVQPSAPPALRIDAVENAASQLADPLSAGETIVVRGAGFGGDAQLSIGGVAIPAISIEPDAITATVPANLPNGAAVVQVQSGGAASNSVLLAVATASPGLFSADGSGMGQGYILNQDGTLNSPSNPAAPGEKITLYATGVGPVSFTNGYAVTQFPVSVYIDGFYCDGVAAVMGPAGGFPGAVYRLTVYVPNPATMVASNPYLQNFTFPPLVGIVLMIDGAASQDGLAISIGQ